MASNRTLVRWSRTIHIYLSIALLIVLGFFSITGITLNHADSMTGVPVMSQVIMDGLPALPREPDGQIADSPEFAGFLHQEFGVRRARARLEQDAGLLIVDYKAPGRSVYVEINTLMNSLRAETTNYGLIAALNDLHKARDTDLIWFWFIDASAVILIVFSLAGFVLLLPNNYRFRRVLAFTAGALAILGVGYFLGTR